MKHDWRQPRMKLSLPVYSNDFLAFLLFLRLTLVVVFCLFGGIVLGKWVGTGAGLAGYGLAFPLWWYHFGLPRFGVAGSGYFSPGFCWLGYLLMAFGLVGVALLYFGVIKEGRPIPIYPEWFPKSRVARYAIIFAALCLVEYVWRKLRWR